MSEAKVVLQDVIMPTEEQQDSVMLYLDTGAAYGAQLNTMTGAPKKELRDLVGDIAVSESDRGAQVDSLFEDVIDRRSIRIHPGKRVSFGTYFNAFPASYWRRWTTVETISLSVRTRGHGTLIIYKSNARGSIQHVRTVRVEDVAQTEIELSLKSFGDGGWYWFDVVTNEDGMILQEASWRGITEPKPKPKLSVEITTMNKTEFCIRNLQSLIDHPKALDLVDELIVVDQGTELLAEDPQFHSIAKQLSPKLRIIEQENIGGSGGFSRGMYEAVRNGSDFVLLLDDDIELEPETISRMLTFAQYAKKPTIVGAHMFDLAARSVLHTFGEVVNRTTINPDVPLKGQYLGHDFARANLRETPWLHRRTDVDYNGWWGCLIPTAVIREIGLSLPLFLKWDDAEYGLRAQSRGFATVSLPGAAVWHVSWANKDDTVGWQAYYHARNRLIVGLLYSPHKRGGKLLLSTSALDFKHLISLQYYTTALRQMAENDVLVDPGKLFELQANRINDVRTLASNYSDGIFRSDIDDFPPIIPTKNSALALKASSPSYAQLPVLLLKMLMKQIFPGNRADTPNPEAHLAHVDNKWWRVNMFDSALVTNAEGTALSWYRRDRKTSRRLLLEMTRSALRLRKNWNTMQDALRSRATELVSIDRWSEEFARRTKNERRP